MNEIRNTKKKNFFIGLTVTGLTPEKEYKFRVTAVNAEGESEPLQTEKSIIAKNPFGITFSNTPSFENNVLTFFLFFR